MASPWILSADKSSPRPTAAPLSSKAGGRQLATTATSSAPHVRGLAERL